MISIQFHQQRTARELTLQQAAEAAGIPQYETVFCIEQGNYAPLAVLERLAESYGCTLALVKKEGTAGNNPEAGRRAVPIYQGSELLRED